MKKILLLLILILGLGLASCDEDKPQGETPETPFEFVDYVDQTKLNVTVTSSSSFWESDGVALATLVRCVDGDTALFNANGIEFTARFLGVDTPESTGQVEKWGKTASKFTADKLENAESIVVQTNGGAAQKDTTGTRWLTYVWYRSSATTDYRLLNLELVQEGLSYGKSATASLYADVLILAQNQAMHQKLRLFGDDIDPNYYYGDAIETTIKYIIENRDELIKETAKVVFDCTITRVDGLYVYAQDYDAETDQIYSILLYKGYNLNTRKLEPGYRVSVCGNVQEYNGHVQLSGMTDIPLIETRDNIQVLDKNYGSTVTTITPDDLKNTDEAFQRLLVKLENVKVVSLWTTKDGDSKGAVTITGTVDGKTVTIRTSVLMVNYELITEDYYRGHTITVIGVVEEYNGTNQIKVVSIDDVDILDK